MPNGQYHGKKNRSGIRVKNPLPMSVEVDITDDHGFGTCRTLRPGAEVYVKVPQQGDYDVKVGILRYDHTGKASMLGDASWEEVSTAVPKSSPAAVAGPRIIHGKKALNCRRWKNVVTWKIPQGFSGQLMAISIKLSGDAEARVDLPGNRKPNRVIQDITLPYKNLSLNTGQTVWVKGRSIIGNDGMVEVMMQGQLYPVGSPVPVRKGSPEHITEKKPREPEEPIRSLGEMMEEMEKREAVKV